LLVSTLCQIIYLPTEYSSITPYQFEINRNYVALEMPLCGTTQYVGCTFKVEFNLPFTGWSIADGTYLNFTVTGNGDACATTLCQNDPTSNDPGSCSFVYQSKMGDRIFVVGLSGRAAGFQATFNMKTTCSSVDSPKQVPTGTLNHLEKSGFTACPQADPTKRFVNLVTPGTVITSPKTSDAMKYSLSVCPDQKASASVTYSLQGTDQKSAFATYFCSLSNCNTNNSPQGWFDQSGTALNYVRINSLSSQVVYVTIYGWGEYQGTNSFVFNIEINDQ